MNKNDFVLEYYESDEPFALKFGFNHWVDGEKNITRIYVLRWKPEKNPYSNDENSSTRDIGYISFSDDSTSIAYSYMKRKYRGTGLGNLLYKKVAKEEGYLTTNFNYASDMAQHLWKKLFTKFPTRRFYDDGPNYRIYAT